MSTNITKIKIRRQNGSSNNDTEVLNLTGSDSIKKIIFNGKSYLPSNGEVSIDSSFAKELLATKTLRKKVYNITDNPTIQYDVNDILFIKENNNELSGYSCFVFDDDGNAIRLTTPSQPFATEDLDFTKVLSAPFPKFANWWSFKNYFDECYPDNQAYNEAIRGKPRNLIKKAISGNLTIDGNNYNYNEEIIYCLFYNQETESGIKNHPYIVYKINEYYIKQYISNDSVNGVLELKDDFSYVNKTSSSLITLNQFARNIERIK